VIRISRSPCARYAERLSSSSLREIKKVQTFGYHSSFFLNLCIHFTHQTQNKDYIRQKSRRKLSKCAKNIKKKQSKHSIWKHMTKLLVVHCPYISSFRCLYFKGDTLLCQGIYHGIIIRMSVNKSTHFIHILNVPGILNVNRWRT